MKVKITKYYCDVCGKELDQQEAEGDFLELPTVKDGGSDYLHMEAMVMDESLQVCDECLKKIAIGITNTLAEINDRYKEDAKYIPYLKVNRVEKDNNEEK